MDATTLNNAIILDGVMAIALMDILLWLDINIFFCSSNSFIIIRMLYVWAYVRILLAPKTYIVRFLVTNWAMKIIYDKISRDDISIVLIYCPKPLIGWDNYFYRPKYPYLMWIALHIAVILSMQSYYVFSFFYCSWLKKINECKIKIDNYIVNVYVFYINISIYNNPWTPLGCLYIYDYYSHKSFCPFNLFIMKSHPLSRRRRVLLIHSVIFFVSSFLQ